eukprot:1677072-Rhodomonas_salina.3
MSCWRNRVCESIDLFVKDGADGDVGRKGTKTEDLERRNIAQWHVDSASTLGLLDTLQHEIDIPSHGDPSFTSNSGSLSLDYYCWRAVVTTEFRAARAGTEDTLIAFLHPYYDEFTTDFVCTVSDRCSSKFSTICLLGQPPSLASSSKVKFDTKTCVRGV